MDATLGETAALYSALPQIRAGRWFDSIRVYLLNLWPCTQMEKRYGLDPYDMFVSSTLTGAIKMDMNEQECEDCGEAADRWYRQHALCWDCLKNWVRGAGMSPSVLRTPTTKWDHLHTSPAVGDLLGKADE